MDKGDIFLLLNQNYFNIVISYINFYLKIGMLAEALENEHNILRGINLDQNLEDYKLPPDSITKSSNSSLTFSKILFGKVEKENINNNILPSKSRIIKENEEENQDNTTKFPSSRIDNNSTLSQLISPLKMNRSHASHLINKSTSNQHHNYGSVAALYSNIFENIAHSIIEKSTSKPEVSLLKMHKNILNYKKAFYTKGIEKSIISKHPHNKSHYKSIDEIIDTRNDFKTTFRDEISEIKADPKDRRKSFGKTDIILSDGRKDIIKDVIASYSRVGSPTIYQSRLTLTPNISNLSSRPSLISTNRGEISHRSMVDTSKVFKKPMEYKNNTERTMTVNFQNFINERRKMIMSPTIVKYNTKFDINSPYHPAINDASSIINLGSMSSGGLNNNKRNKSYLSIPNYNEMNLLKSA